MLYPTSLWADDARAVARPLTKQAEASKEQNASLKKQEVHGHTMDHGHPNTVSYIRIVKHSEESCLLVWLLKKWITESASCSL